jgi:glycosyltransferase involved in cell wall biosynthesis
MTAIIIPAHNEAAVIGQTIKGLLQQVGDHDEVIVVCNGCSDDTAGVARRFEPRVTVLETAVPSKTNALNLGDSQARSFPRIYLDADVILGEGALTKIVRALESGRWLAVSPDPAMNLEGVSWAVRAYYDIWLSLPYCRSGMIGAGVYALSEAGRARFGEFPSVIADDGYVRAMFKEAERGRVEDASSMVRAPASLGWLLKIKTRSRLGGMELEAKFPRLLANEVKDYSGALRGMIANPLNWPKVLVYLYVNLRSRILAKRRLKDLTQYRWEKDLSSRR